MDHSSPEPAHAPHDRHETSLSRATRAVTSGRPARTGGAPVNPPVVLSSTYVSAGVPQPGEKLYTRAGTETWEPFEQAVADLEGASEPGIVFASGMAAIAAVLSFVPDGGTLVVPRHAYQVTLGFADDLAARHGVRVVRVDVAETAATVAAFEGADLVWIESPTNPMLEVADVPALVDAAHRAGALVAVDNTFATPLVQRPLELGADVVVHSVTKYLAGHSDVVLGLAATSSPHLAEQIRAYRTLHGAVAGPWEVWLALRGLRTLALRVERAQANAAELARRLQTHPAVAEVRHPSLPTDPGHAVAARDMDGFGAILGVRPRGGAAAADAVVDAVRLWVPATSLGGVESSLERRRRFSTESLTVPDDLLRLSVGIEDVDDLWADLDGALNRIVAEPQQS
ncbi:trans-sulfuration enzyme family protein [Sanguibacter suaedae]|uniref:homocysteine desulfhydrase n=1 Tax=Sanguibacter suaedae TaxID=2795737 RepID=A0A934I797_9MICO|nr:aminotransferase class I/II-fold pyridoxal phosphate-dependent enzyme [Sanguibacter suaedae]MBI9114467.1 aminotransferase class I/II-fold pyridoxal phosphate-dependent enzyme [Sanguibacter suaedae]